MDIIKLKRKIFIFNRTLVLIFFFLNVFLIFFAVSLFTPLLEKNLFLIEKIMGKKNSDLFFYFIIEIFDFIVKIFRKKEFILPIIYTFLFIIFLSNLSIFYLLINFLKRKINNINNKINNNINNNNINNINVNDKI